MDTRDKINWIRVFYYLTEMAAWFGAGLGRLMPQFIHKLFPERAWKIQFRQLDENQSQACAVFRTALGVSRIETLDESAFSTLAQYHFAICELFIPAHYTVTNTLQLPIRARQSLKQAINLRYDEFSPFPKNQTVWTYGIPYESQQKLCVPVVAFQREQLTSSLERLPAPTVLTRVLVENSKKEEHGSRYHQIELYRRWAKPHKPPYIAFAWMFCFTALLVSLVALPYFLRQQHEHFNASRMVVIRLLKAEKQAQESALESRHYTKLKNARTLNNTLSNFQRMTLALPDTLKVNSLDYNQESWSLDVIVKIDSSQIDELEKLGWRQVYSQHYDVEGFEKKRFVLSDQAAVAFGEEANDG